MLSVFSDFLTQLRGIWSRLDAGQRLVVGSVLLATMVGLGAMVWFAGQPSHEVVYTATTNDDLGAAKQALEQANIDYRLDATGMSFLVDSQMTGVARSAIRGEGLLTQDSGTELGVSSIIDDRETKLWKLTAATIAKAELAVRNIGGVLKVVITGSPPRRARAFVDRDKSDRPTAAVLVSLRSGTSFLEVAPKAANLTAAALGLPRQDITVSSSAGRATYRYDPDREAAGSSSEFHELERQMSQQRTSRAQDLLDTMWPNQTSVTVVVELDPTWEVVSQKMLPDGEIKRTEKRTEESVETTPTRGGSSITGPGSESEGAKKDKTTNTTTETEYVAEVGERRSGLHAPPIKRLTVAVLYDKELDAENAAIEADLERTVKAMVGWDADRDDDIGFSVLAGTFPEIDFTQYAAAEPGMFELAQRWGPPVGQILGVIVVILFLRGLFKRARKPAAHPMTSSVGATEETMAPEEQQRRMRREIERTIANDPEALAKMLDAWLVEQGT